MTSSLPKPTQPGLRERKKAEKSHLIRQAARQLFTTQGYEATTMRQVAALADVGFGTVSAYASDKAGLLAMVFVEDLEHLPPLFDKITPATPLLEQLTERFTRLYRFWAKNPDLSRIVLPQMEFYNSNPFTDAIMKRRGQVQADLAEWLGRWQAQGRLVAHADAEQAAAALFAIYTSALRDWITCEPLVLAQGRKRLAYLFAPITNAIETTTR